MSLDPSRRFAASPFFTLLLAAALAGAPLAADDELPSAAEVIARYVEAIGGEEAIRAHTSMTETGSFDMPAMGMSAETTTYSMAPDKTLFRMTMPGMGETVQGYNGEIAWAEDPMQGTRLIEGEMLVQIQRDNRFYGELEYDEIYPEQTVAGEVERNGQAAYQLDLVDASGNESRQYFAKDTGLLIGMEGSQTSDMGTADISTDFEDYQEFGGVLLPTTQTLSMMGMEIIVTRTNVTFDDVDLNVFEPSDAVKALLPE